MRADRGSEPASSLYDSNDYYASDEAASRLSPVLNPLFGWMYRRAAAGVLRQVGLEQGAGRTALDIGAGDGAFLEAVRAHGLEVDGTTLSDRSRRAAQQRRGVELALAELPTPAMLARGYDLVTYWHVFEHLTEPSSHTRLWPRLLRAGGHLVIEVPNIESIGARLSYRAWLGSDDKHHVNHQPPARIRAQLAAAGLEVTAESGWSTKFTYPYLWSALLGALFGGSYDFDSVLAVLKSPVAELRRRPLRTLNALAAVAYLAPVVALLAAFGLATGRGEVYRVIARRR